jgi:hypothetical protein
VQDPQQDQELPEVGPFDRRVYQAIAAYAFDEPECHPSQQLIAYEVGCVRETVNRSVQRLVRAGWLRIRKRWSFRSRWMHNVYELMAPFAVSPLTAKRIIRRAHRRARRVLRNAFARPDHTNPKGWVWRGCGCRFCRSRRPSPSWRVQRPPPLPGSTCEWGSDEWWRWRFGEQRGERMVLILRAVEAAR